MPNGRSGGFRITRDRLGAFLRAIPSDTVIAKGSERPVTAGAVASLLAKHTESQVKIEEQDHAWYIIHLATWLSVDQSSQLYPSLRRDHVDWLKNPLQPDPAGSGMLAAAGGVRVAFPELRRDGVLDLPVVVLSGVAGAMLLGNARRSILAGVLGIVVSLPWAWWLLRSAWLGVSNAIRRYRWSRQFRRRLNCRALRTAVAADPQRFVMHVRLFGRFGDTGPCPAAVLEDCLTGELAAVYPPSWLVTDLCEELGLRLIKE